MITFNALLNVPALKTLNVAAGHGGLGREIKAVSVMDAPDSYRWLKGGEFIMTSAYLFANDPKIMELFLMNLIEAGSAGLGIKKGRFLNSIPEIIISIANTYQFPIVEIPYHFGWSDVMAVFYELLYNEAEESYPALEPNHIEQIYGAGRWGSDRLMDKLTELFNTPLAIVLSNKKITKDNGLPGVKLIGGALEASELFPEEMGEEILTAGKYFVTVCAIPFYNQDQKEYLAVMSRNKNFFTEIKKLFQILATIGERDNTQAADTARIYRKFMLGVISGRIARDEIADFEKNRGFDESVRTGIICVYSADYKSVCHQLSQTLKKNRLANKGRAVSHIVENAAKKEAVVMLELHMKDNTGSVNEWQRVFFEEMEYCLQESREGYLSAGRFFTGLDNILSGYREAREAYVIGKALWKGKRCYLYSMLSAYGVLYNADPSKIDLSYIESLDNQQEFSFDGIATLEACIEYGGYKKAAEKLYVHENTLRYRIQKIGDYLHLDLDDPTVEHFLITQIKLWKLYRSARYKNRVKE